MLYSVFEVTLWYVSNPENYSMIYWQHFAKTYCEHTSFAISEQLQKVFECFLGRKTKNQQEAAYIDKALQNV